MGLAIRFLTHLQAVLFVGLSTPSDLNAFGSFFRPTGKWEAVTQLYPHEFLSCVDDFQADLAAEIARQSAAGALPPAGLRGPPVYEKKLPETKVPGNFL